MLLLDAVRLLNFNLDGVEASISKLLVGVTAGLRIWIFRRIDKDVLDVSVAGAEFVEHSARFLFQALEAGGKITVQIQRNEQGVLHLIDEGFRAFIQTEALVFRQVQAEKAKLANGHGSDHEGGHPKPLEEVFRTCAHQFRL